MIGDDVKPQQLGSDLDSKVAMANANEIKKVGLTDEERELSDENAMKKTMEAGIKRNQEQRAKIRREEQDKKVALHIKGVSREERNKEFDDTLRLKSEMSKKKGIEQMKKLQARAAQSLEDAERSTANVRLRVERAKRIQAAQLYAAERTAKSRFQLQKDRFNEALKKSKEKGMKRKHEAMRKFKREILHKKRSELVIKQKEEVRRKKTRELEKKVRARDRSKREKKAKKIVERQKKSELKKPGKWCKCRAMRVHFEHNNRWHACPTGTLMAGWYRGRYDNLQNLYYLYCCAPCGPRGRKQKRVYGCTTADWVHSFDRAGWSNCKANTYLAGLYKSSCNWIYCLEYARCCSIFNSKGSRNCKTNNKWQKSFDHQGWTRASEDHFITGLYRSNSHKLHNIEYAKECKFYAHSLKQQ